MCPMGGRALTLVGVDGGGVEGLPQDGFTDVAWDGEGKARAQAVPFIMKLIQKEDDQACHKELQN